MSLVHNAADQGQVEAGNLATKRGRELHLENLRAVLATTPGRELLWSYVEPYYAEIFSPGSERDLNFEKGMRSVTGRMLRDIGEASPEALQEMLKRYFIKTQGKEGGKK